MHFLNIYIWIFLFQDVDIYYGYLGPGSSWDIYLSRFDLGYLIIHKHEPKSPPSASRCSLSSSLACGAAWRRDGPRQRRPRCTGCPPLGQPCVVAPCLQRPQPLPTGREGRHFPCICTCCRNRFHKSAFPALNNLWETRLPLIQTFTLVVPPLSPIVHALNVVLCLAPGVSDIRPQAGCYQAVQSGYQLLAHHESFRRSSVIVQNLAVKLGL